MWRWVCCRWRCGSCSWAHAPLGDAEAQQALAALRTVNDQMPGDALIADSPLTFILNALTFGFRMDGEVGGAAAGGVGRRAADTRPGAVAALSQSRCRR